VLHSDLHYYYTIPLDETSIRETLIQGFEKPDIFSGKIVHDDDLSPMHHSATPSRPSGCFLCRSGFEELHRLLYLGHDVHVEGAALQTDATFDARRSLYWEPGIPFPTCGVSWSLAS
jgi:hypothetical protein